jgi:predicted O-linked N-acetylglucosamine transferase (SPINDLY family)
MPVFNKGIVGRPQLVASLSRVHRLLSEAPARLRNAIANSDIGLALIPASAEAKLNIKRQQKARRDSERALAIDPKNLAAWRRLGHAYSGLKRYKKAIICYEKALALEPENSIIWKARAAAIKELGKKAPPLDLRHPRDADMWTIRAGALWLARRFAETVEACDQALALDPENIGAARLAIHTRLHSCDWSRREVDKRRVTEGLKRGDFIIRAMDHRGLTESEEELRIAVQFVAREFPPSETPLWRGERYDHEKIRIGYLSTDFNRHAVASLIVGCFEHHDKMRFETTAISLGKDDKSEMRRRIEAAFDRFIDVKDVNDAKVAGMIRELEIDIAIDLNGYTGHSRSGILARRPAPVQVNYLGFAGTMDVAYIDYIIADHVVMPEQQQIHYSEKVVCLPHAYLPNDRKRRIADETPCRIEAELPETGFVFACFNNAYKIGPEIFDVWMRLLREVERSVLWLQSASNAAVTNLRREAMARGIAPERLVFAPHVARPEGHLARLRLVDLFLDTLPYNAHATACDALWAGVPVITCTGKTFPGRVASSLLHAVGMPELVTASLAEYEELALTLARNPERLAALKEKLARNRNTEPLFDTARFTRDLESAYIKMWERQQSQLSPESFAVASAH